MTMSSYSAPIVPISKNKQSFFFFQNFFSNHNGVLLGKFWDEAVIIKLLPRTPGDPGTVLSIRQPNITLIHSDHLAPDILYPVTMGKGNVQ